MGKIDTYVSVAHVERDSNTRRGMTPTVQPTQMSRSTAVQNVVKGLPICPAVDAMRAYVVLPQRNTHVIHAKRNLLV